MWPWLRWFGRGRLLSLRSYRRYKVCSYQGSMWVNIGPTTIEHAVRIDQQQSRSRPLDCVFGSTFLDLNSVTAFTSYASTRTQAASIYWKHASDARFRAMEDLYGLESRIWSLIICSLTYSLLIFLSIGDIVFLHLPIRPVIILGSVKAAFDLLDKRSHLYSDRVPSKMNEL